MATVRIGIIGCGGRITGVVDRVLQQNKQIRVTALSDPNPESIRMAKDRLGGDPAVYEDYRKLVKADDVDWVFVGSWNCFHKDHVIAAFKAGKNVFCEKPLATTLSDCVAMEKAWKKSGREFSLGFCLRYSPHYERIKKLLDDGVVGRIVSMEFNETLGYNHGGYIMADWRRLTKNAGTHLLEKCCHDVDLVNWMVGSAASRVASFGSLNFFRPENKDIPKKLGKEENGATPYRTWFKGREHADDGLSPFTSDKDIIDNQVAIIEYANGVRTTFHTNMNTSINERRMYFCGTEGTLRADVAQGSIEWQRIGPKTKKNVVDTSVRGGHGGGDEVLAKEIVGTLLRGKAPRAGIRDGILSAVTCFGVDKAMESGRVVDMSSLWKKAGVDVAEPEGALA